MLFWDGADDTVSVPFFVSFSVLVAKICFEFIGKKY